MPGGRSAQSPVCADPVLDDDKHYWVDDAEIEKLLRRGDGWLDVCDQLVAGDPDWFTPTARLSADVTEGESQAAAIAWWEQLTASGGEGIVVKPITFIAQGRKGLAQPGIKCRGREYLRTMYGPEYAKPSQINRLRNRNLARKRGLAIREFGLGVEGLTRFIGHQPLYQVHECVFGVPALESEPVDRRL